MNTASLIGGIIGFLFGAYLGGPLIGLFFAFIGSSLGSGILRGASRRENPGWFSGARSSSGPVFMETLFSMLGRLAAADGHVSSQEEQFFRSVVTGELGVRDPASVTSAVRIFRQSASGSTPMGVYARRAAAAFRQRPQLLEMMMMILIRAASASGGLHPEEDRLMREAAAIFGFHPALYESLKMRYGPSFGSRSGNRTQSYSTVSDLKRSYDALGVRENASEQDIRRAYRKKAAEYHPDKMAAKGLPKDFTEMATRKFQEIQEAWDQICSARGFK